MELVDNIRPLAIPATATATIPVPALHVPALQLPLQSPSLPSATAPAAARLNSPSAICLLDGFSRLLQFLFEAEADYLCGVALYSHSPKRVNYRYGYHSRQLPTPIGSFRVRAPSLRYVYPRVSIAKRAKRLAPEILETLSRILGFSGGTPSVSSESASLIKALWTIDLPVDLFVQLITQLTPILEDWREQSRSQKAEAGGQSNNAAPLPALPAARRATTPIQFRQNERNE